MPKQENIELPLLKVLKDAGGSLSIPDAIAKTKELYPELTDEEKASMLTSGENRLNNRIAWCRQRLVEKGEIDSSTRGIWKITEEGKKRVELEWPSWKAEYVEIKTHIRTQRSSESMKRQENVTTPIELIDSTIEEMTEDVKAPEKEFMNKAGVKFNDTSSVNLAERHIRVFLAPRSNETSYEGFQSTIKNGISYMQIEPYLSQPLKEILAKQKKIYAWGCVDSLKGRWDKMREGDYVLFYVKGTFRYYGRTLCKQYSDQLSDVLWPRKTENAWGCIFFLDDIEPISIPMETLNKIAGYKENFVPQGFQELKEDAVGEILKEYGSMENFFAKEESKSSDIIEENIEPVKPADINIILKESTNWKIEINKETHRINTGSPETIQDIVKFAAEGKWVLPEFQRNYVWDEEQIKELLESILRDYFIGNFLVWEVKQEKNKLEFETKCINGANPQSDQISGIILDGQQRITSLYKAIKAPEVNLEDKMNSYFYIDFNAWMKDVTNDSIVAITYRKYSDEETYESFYFPFYRIDNYRIWTNGLRKYLRNKKEIDEEKIDDIIDFISAKLDHFWKNYNVPIIRLPENIGLESMSIIFERINTKGEELNVFDLLVARLFRYNVKLRKLWDETKEIEIKRYYGIYKEKIPVLMVQGMSLYYNPTHSAKRNEILNIFESVYKNRPIGSFESDWKDFAEYLKEAIKRIENPRNGYGVRGEKNLPSTSTLPVLAALLKKIKELGGNADLYSKLDMWYWSAILTNAYSGAADTVMAQDVKDVIEWFKNDENIPRTVVQAQRKWESGKGLEYLKELISSSNSTYKGILSLIGLKGAKDFRTGQTFESSAVNNFDHIFPKSKFKEHQYVNSILNITWLTGGTNKNIKKAKLPSEFIEEFRAKFNSEEEFKKVLDSHFINEEAYQAMKHDNLGMFIEKRGEVILKEIINRIGGEYEEKVYTQIRPETPFNNKLAIKRIIKQAEEYIEWIDKYFSVSGLEMINEYVNRDNVKKIAILTSYNAANNKFRDKVKDLKEQFSKEGILLEVRVITDKKISDSIHDRYLITKGHTYNIPSPDVVERGQFSDIKEVNSSPPFSDWWSSSLDIIDDWNRIHAIS